MITFYESHLYFSFKYDATFTGGNKFLNGGRSSLNYILCHFGEILFKTILNKNKIEYLIHLKKIATADPSTNNKISIFLKRIHFLIGSLEITGQMKKSIEF